MEILIPYLTFLLFKKLKICPPDVKAHWSSLLGGFYMHFSNYFFVKKNSFLTPTPFP